MIPTRAQATSLRKVIEQAADLLPDEDALKEPILSEHWAADQHYTVGKRLYYNGTLYSVLQEHDSQATWTPDVSPSLFAPVLIPDPTVIPDWVQPESTNPYMIGDKVRHVGHIWESLVDNNVWEPGAIGTQSLWAQVD